MPVSSESCFNTLLYEYTDRPSFQIPAIYLISFGFSCTPLQVITDGISWNIKLDFL